MAAGEDQPQPVIRQLAHVRLLALTLPFEGVRRCRVGPDQQRQLATQRLVAAQRIQGASARGGGEPGPGVGGDAALCPAGEGSDEGVLDALLGNIEITGQAHRRSKHERPLTTVRLGQRPPDLGRRLADLVHALGGAPEVSMIGRSSTPPPGAGHSLANPRAWSRSAASIR